MCIGLPMRVIAAQPGRALCRGMGQQREVDTLLVGDQPVGSWLLVFLDSAREVLSDARAEQISEALTALELALRGETQVDHLFADLIEREPSLPAHLQTKPADPASGV
ncbi:MAG: HypC/HybG/HupF family hydrogenase formation chaperone [Candidatus Thiodiazotropha sp.]|jgi:hydrogenase expression/formation protein HypC